MRLLVRYCIIISLSAPAWAQSPPTEPLPSAEPHWRQPSASGKPSTEPALPAESSEGPFRYRIESLPFGAEVRVEGEGGARTLGVTPLDFTLPEPLEGTLVVEAPGYAPQRHPLAAEPETVLLLRLVPLYGEAPPVAVRVESAPRGFGWVDAAAVGVGVLAAGLSVHYKTEADRQWDTYRVTRDPALREAVRAGDRNAALALGVSALGLGTFAVRLALR
jgi:hypothetical protein